MPNVLCFGRELSNVSYTSSTKAKFNALFVDSDYVGQFPIEQHPLEAYSDYLSRKILWDNEAQALRNLQSICLSMSDVQVIGFQLGMARGVV